MRHRLIAVLVAAMVSAVIGVGLASSLKSASANLGFDTPGATPEDQPADLTGPAPAEHATMSANDARLALAALPPGERHRGGYDRTLFGDGWTITNGCTTRQHVLAAEAIAGTVDPTTCAVDGGVWVDWYSVETTNLTDPRALDIDHLVPLAHAWQAGAWAWTPEQRQAFANDLTNPTTLTAVSAGQNRAKADAPPDAWQPPNHAARCTYAKDWITVKTTWSLTVTPAETAALEQMLNHCDH